MEECNSSGSAGQDGVLSTPCDSKTLEASGRFSLARRSAFSWADATRSAGLSNRDSFGGGSHRLSLMQTLGRPTSAFLRMDRSRTMEEMNQSQWQLRLANFLEHNFVETANGMVVLFTIGLLIVDTDCRADLPGRGSMSPPAWTAPLLGVSFGLFAVETVARIFVEQSKYLYSFSNRLDIIVLLAGAVEYIIAFAGSATSSLNTFRVIRLCRLLRVLRLVRLFQALQELAWLLQMMGSCIKTVFWSLLLLVLIMTVWAILAVEVLNPLVQEMPTESAWEGCPRCQRAFSSVFLANITLFQTIVAGDSWGLMALPLIEQHPWTAIIFVGSLMTLVFGVLNLIVAVVIDAYAKERAGNVRHIAEELDSDEVKEKRELARMFTSIDANGSGTLTLDEVKEGAQTVEGFSQWLRVLDIDAEDLEVLFQMVDRDASGSICSLQFIEAMYRLKNTEPKTATRFVKHTLEAMLAKVDLGMLQSQQRAGEIDEIIHHTRVIQLRLQQQAEDIQDAVDTALKQATVATQEIIAAAVGESPLLQPKADAELASAAGLAAAATAPHRACSSSGAEGQHRLLVPRGGYSSPEAETERGSATPHTMCPRIGRMGPNGEPSKLIDVERHMDLVAPPMDQHWLA